MSIIKIDLFGPVNPGPLCDYIVDSFGPGMFVPGEEPIAVIEAKDNEHFVMSSFTVDLFTPKRLFLIHQKKKKYQDYPYNQLVDYGIAKDGLISKRFVLEFYRDLISFPKKDELIELVVPAIREYSNANL